MLRSEKSFLVTYCALNSFDNQFNEWEMFLSEEEKLYFNSLKYDRRRESFLLGRLTAKKSISNMLSLDPRKFQINRGIFDFPIISGISKNISVSISHSNHIGLALAYPDEHPLGIDLEIINQENEQTIKNFTRDHKEVDVNKYYDHSLMYYVNWTAKEALSKILKTGLTADYKVFELSTLKCGHEHFESEFKYFAQYRAVTMKIENYMCSIVLPKRTQVDLSSLWDGLKKTIE